MRRWQEIKIRQRRLLADQEQTAPAAHLEQIMKSGFSMSDIKGLQRGYSEDAVEADEMLLKPEVGQKSRRPSRPPRKGSLSRFDDNALGQMDTLSPEKNRSTSELDLNKFQNGDAKDKKSRGKSPFRFVPNFLS